RSPWATRDRACWRLQGSLTLLRVADDATAGNSSRHCRGVNGPSRSRLGAGFAARQHSPQNPRIPNDDVPVRTMIGTPFLRVILAVTLTAGAAASSHEPGRRIPRSSPARETISIENSSAAL